MNYLTNYYKNLSEQLQEKINILESYLHNLNEDLEPGIMQQGGGAGVGVGTGSPNQPNNNSDLNAFLQAWGTSDPSYDFNGDGVVDGNDLGVFLAGMLNRGGNTPTVMASTSIPSTPGEIAGTPARKVKAIDQPGLGVEKGTPTSYDSSIGSYVKPSQKTPKYNITPTTSSDEVLIGKKSRPNFGTGNVVLQSTNNRGDIDSPSKNPPAAIERGQVPYWMSSSTTDVDSSFRSMTPARKRK